MMDISKRHFLTGCGTLIAGISIYSVAKEIVESETGMGVDETPTIKYAMVHDENLCIGCNACEEACREVNNVPEGVSRVVVNRTGPFGEYPNLSYRFSRKSCQHCEDAPCVKVCPTGAAYIDSKTGIVSVNPDKCVGCQYCIAACPYQVRFINPVTKTADKCDFCKETQLKQGKQPACVEACPTHALVFGNLRDPNSELVKTLKSKPTYRTKTDLGTRPKLFHVSTIDGEIVL